MRTWIKGSRFTASNRRTLLDPNHYFDLIEISSEIEGNRHRKHKFEITEIGNFGTITNWVTTDADDNETFSRTLSELSPEEAREIKETVEAAVAAAEKPATAQPPVTDEKNTWKDWLVSPRALAIGWPVIAVVFLAVDLLCDRFRWKAN